MGKRKSGTGITGLSRFVTALNEGESVAQSSKSTNSVDLAVSAYEQDDSSINEATGAPPTDSASAPLSIPVGEVPKKQGVISRYDATGLVPTYTDESMVPDHLKKYFSQRTRYFSLYDKPPGCLLDEEGWYSVTPERVANQIAERCRCNVVLDAFCGVGGNTIAFAKTCEQVIALDTNPTRLALARHNAQIYGVADRIEFIQADYISFAHSLTSTSSSPLTTSPPQSNLPRKIDVVFLSPPWGGPSYLSGSPSRGIADGNKENSPQTTGQGSHPTYSLSSIQPIHGQDLFTLTRKITSNIAYYLPRNTDLSEISGLLNAIDDQGSPVRLPGEQIEVEEEWMGSKLKALTCYFGGLVAGQEELFC